MTWLQWFFLLIKFTACFLIVLFYFIFLIVLIRSTDNLNPKKEGHSQHQKLTPTFPLLWSDIAFPPPAPLEGVIFFPPSIHSTLLPCHLHFLECYSPCPFLLLDEDFVSSYSICEGSTWLRVKKTGIVLNTPISSQSWERGLEYISLLSSHSLTDLVYSSVLVLQSFLYRSTRHQVKRTDLVDWQDGNLRISVVKCMQHVCQILSPPSCGDAVVSPICFFINYYVITRDTNLLIALSVTMSRTWISDSDFWSSLKFRILSLVSFILILIWFFQFSKWLRHRWYQNWIFILHQNLENETSSYFHVITSWKHILVSTWMISRKCAIRDSTHIRYHCTDLWYLCFSIRILIDISWNFMI